MGAEDGMIDQATLDSIAEWNLRYGTGAVGSQGASTSQAAQAQALGALFGLPTYSGTNAVGAPYSNSLKPGADYLAKRTAQAAENERVTNAFTPKSYMPAWAVQQPAADWLGKGFTPGSYFPGLTTSGPANAGVPRGTNLGFGTLFGTLAPSTQTPGGGAPNGTYTPPAVTPGPVTPPYFPPVGGGLVPGGGGQGGTLPGGVPLATPERPGGQGPATAPLTGGTSPMESWLPAGATESGIGSTQYPVYSQYSQYKPPRDADYTYGNMVPATTSVRGKQYEVNLPEGAGYETYLRTILALAGGGPGINNVGLEAAIKNPALLAGYGNTPNWTPGMLGTVTPINP
jgi:hypothetical protein